ncbi:unnamed protein product [Rotaria socialis]|uniref:Uncharacterized protein n=1 Tax=Rotaria socialis TaxID=392032 RepID=A0A819V0J5_9BILA|nr:unnamed protein product [Rotaria socialis]CAF4275720.1 unnamed protein product [Rotaria socialis]CAF4444838.1 unnamed protein product [Rotaria socialis]
MKYFDEHQAPILASNTYEEKRYLLIHPVGYSSCQTLSIVAYVNAQSFIVSLLAFDIRNDQVIIITHYCFLTRGFLIKRNENETANRLFISRDTQGQIHIEYKKEDKLVETIQSVRTQVEQKLDVDNNQLMKRISKSVSNILQHRSGYVSSRSHSTIADPDSARASSTYRPVQATRVQRH